MLKVYKYLLFSLVVALLLSLNAHARAGDELYPRLLNRCGILFQLMASDVEATSEIRTKSNDYAQFFARESKIEVGIETTKKLFLDEFEKFKRRAELSTEKEFERWRNTLINKCVDVHSGN